MFAPVRIPLIDESEPIVDDQINMTFGVMYTRHRRSSTGSMASKREFDSRYRARIRLFFGECSSSHSPSASMSGGT